MIKSRSTLSYKGTRSWYFTVGGSVYPGSQQSATESIFENQITSTSGTAFASKRNAKRFKGTDMGGDFSTQKSLRFQPKEISIDSGKAGYVVYYYSGPYFATTPTVGSYVAGPSIGQMRSYGATCIAKTLPTNPLSGMGQFLGELRDLPKLPLLKLMKARAQGFRAMSRATGSEYLNVAFGWMPFVKDLLSLSETLAKADEHIAQYDRDSGRVVRRRITLLETSSAVVTNMGTSYGYPPRESPLYISPGKLTKTVTTSTRIWFSGAYTYYVSSGQTPGSISKDKRGGNVTSFIPPRSDPKLVRQRAAQIRHKLYGLRLDPYLLYQLYPWSWAADWMTNLGSNIRNLVAFQNDGLVLKYGYVMHQTRVTTVYSLDGIKFYSGGPSNFTDTYVQVTKVRIKATPFGFGLNPDTFSARQLAIIAALGMSRGPR